MLKTDQDYSCPAPETGTVRTCDAHQERLKLLNATAGLSWRKIAARKEYKGIPPGTLCTYAKTGKLPHKWRRRLGLADYALAEVCPIHGVVHVRRCPGSGVVHHRDLFAMGEGELRQALINRVVIGG